MWARMHCVIRHSSPSESTPSHTLASLLLFQQDKLIPDSDASRCPSLCTEWFFSLTTPRRVPSLHLCLLKYLHLQEDLLDQLQDPPPSLSISPPLHFTELTTVWYLGYIYGLMLSHKMKDSGEGNLSTFPTRCWPISGNIFRANTVWGRWRKEWMGCGWSHTGPSVWPFHFLDLE